TKQSRKSLGPPLVIARSNPLPSSLRGCIADEAIQLLGSSGGVFLLDRHVAFPPRDDDGYGRPRDDEEPETSLRGGIADEAIRTPPRVLPFARATLILWAWLWTWTHLGTKLPCL
ncbi:MAG: hypothetical protein ACXW3R_15555, partial [Rhodoplanes sp.]